MASHLPGGDVLAELCLPRVFVREDLLHGRTREHGVVPLGEVGVLLLEVEVGAEETLGGVVSVLAEY